MHHELERRFAERFPTLFCARPTGHASGTLIGTGCDCSNGWHDLLECACVVITAHEEGSGVALEWRTKFIEIKEKYGELRVNVRGHSDAFVDGVIDHLEQLSRHVCETCGEPGSMRKRSGWYGVRCDDCVAADPHKGNWEHVSDPVHEEDLEDALQVDIEQLRLPAKAETSVVALGNQIAEFYRGRIVHGGGWKPPRILGARTLSSRLEFEFSAGFDADSEVAGWVALTQAYAAMHMR